MRRRFATALVVAWCTGAPGAHALHAQGALSTQGFGYPSGQLSARALGAGGSLADFDPNSPLNPASLVVGLRTLVYLQYDPEFRDVRLGGRSTTTTTARFPLFGVSGRIWRTTVGLSFSSLLDRTWTNIYDDTQTVGGQLLPSKVTAQSAGGVSDARFAISYSLGKDYHVGAGVHLFPGENRTIIGRDFPDSLKMGSFTQANIFNFSGSAVSLGVLATPLPNWNVAAAVRVGGAMRLRQGDSTVIGTGNVPDRWSLSAAYSGFAGSALAVRLTRERWSALRGLGSRGLAIHDAAELAVGGEIAGPKLSGAPMALRLGFRSRDLPFSAGASAVHEQSLTAGLGVPFAGGRGAMDVSAARARRSASGASENGWIVSIGVGIKP